MNTESALSSFQDDCFINFSQFVFQTESISLRLVAESTGLKDKLAGMNGNGEKLQVIKLSSVQGPLIDRLRSARQFNARGYAVYYLPNEFSPTSTDESYNSVVSFRAFIVDLDGAPLEPVYEFKVPPSIVVNTSEGKYQCIWALDAPLRCKQNKYDTQGTNQTGVDNSLTVDEYAKFSSDLSALFGGDQSVCKATQPFRAPGFVHWKKVNEKGEGYESRIYIRDSGVSGESSGELGEDQGSEQGSEQREDHGKDWGSVYRVCWQDLKGALRDFKRSHKALGRAGRNGKNSSSNQIAGEDIGEEDNFGYQKVNLTELEAGKVKVEPGDRHLTLLREARRLMNDYKGDEVKVREVCEKNLAYFSDGAQFIGGAREGEFLKIIRDAKKYYVVDKEREDAEIKRILDISKEELSREEKGSGDSSELGSGDSSELGSEVLSPPENFQYDFSVGVLPVGRYNESAIVERVIQRFGGDLANLGGTYWCFNRSEKLWIAQSVVSHSEVKARVTTCIKEAVKEPGFVVDVSGGGKPSLSKYRSGVSSLFKAGAVNSMSRGVLNHIAVPKFSHWDFDSNPHLFYCANGVVDLATGQIREARNEDRLLTRSSVTWDPKAKCPGWLKFISEVFAENNEPEEMVAFISEVFAYSISGLMNEQKMFCYLGDGSNGKSITLDALKRICGGYSTIASADELTLSSEKFTKAFERIGAHITDHRVVVVDDFKMSGSWNEGFIKVLTGKEIMSRKLYAEATTQPNRAKFHIGMNKAPKPEEENKGILRRLCFIPFCRSFVASSQKGQELDRMVEIEAPGVLQWAARAVKKVVEKGVTYPQETLAALEEYRQENFKGEVAIEQLYTIPKNENQNGSWEPLSELVEEVNGYYQAQGDNFERVNAEKLGHMFRRAGALKKKVWDLASQNMVRSIFVKKKEKEIAE